MAIPDGADAFALTWWALAIETLERKASPPRIERAVKRANRCDCPGCAPRRNVRVTVYGPNASVGRAIRFAGLNAPNRKQYGVAQYRAQ